MPGNNQIALAIEPLQLEGPLSQYAKAAQVGNMIRQGREHSQRMEQRDLQIDKLRRDAADEENWRGAYTAGGGDPARTIEAARKRGVQPKTIQDYQRQFDEEVKRKSELKKLDFDNTAALTQEIFEAYEVVARGAPEQRPQLYDRATQDLLKRGRIKPEDVKVYDPVTFDIDRAVVTTQANAIKQAAEQRAQADAKRAEAKEKHEEAMRPDQEAKTESDALAAANAAEQTGLKLQGREPIQPAEQVRLDEGKLTPDFKNYRLSQKEGFKGTFEQWQTQDANRRKSNISVYAGQDPESFVQSLALGQITPLGVPAALRSQVLKIAHERGIKIVSDKERETIGAHGKMIPIIESVTELSEKINTGTGVLAKITGAAEKVLAKANLDNDVAEYQSLIQGFTPLVARAVGHTGVLTQQDVDSVKKLFPDPTDSKALRDRKVARLKSIITGVKSETMKNITEPVGGGATPTSTPSSGKTKVWNPATNKFE